MVVESPALISEIRSRRDDDKVGEKGVSTGIGVLSSSIAVVVRAGVTAAWGGGPWDGVCVVVGSVGGTEGDLLFLVSLTFGGNGFGGAGDNRTIFPACSDHFGDDNTGVVRGFADSLLPVGWRDKLAGERGTGRADGGGRLFVFAPPFEVAVFCTGLVGGVMLARVVPAWGGRRGGRTGGADLARDVLVLFLFLVPFIAEGGGPGGGGPGGGSPTGGTTGRSVVLTSMARVGKGGDGLAKSGIAFRSRAGDLCTSGKISE